MFWYDEPSRGCGRLHGARRQADVLRDHDVASVNAVFVRIIPGAPALSPALAATWPQVWANSAALQAGDALRPHDGCARERVHAGAARLTTALLYAEALAGRSLAHF